MLRRATVTDIKVQSYQSVLQSDLMENFGKLLLAPHGWRMMCAASMPDEAVAVVLHAVIAGRPNDDSVIHFGGLEERLMRPTRVLFCRILPASLSHGKGVHGRCWDNHFGDARYQNAFQRVWNPCGSPASIQEQVLPEESDQYRGEWL